MLNRKNQLRLKSTHLLFNVKCVKKIEDYLKFEEGVIKSLVDFKQKKTTVSYLADRTNLENVKTAIANAGYDADDVKADKDAYEKLPKCCKKPTL